jgi:Flp pilus assembly pilin Flp
MDMMKFEKLMRLRTEEGQALGEFSLILAFVALVCVVALTAIGAAVVIPFEDFAGGLGFGS